MADDVAPAEQDKPINDAEAPDTGQAEVAEESFSDFDPSEIPEDADRSWFEEKYNELRSGFTKKTQEFGETRREAETNAKILEALQSGNPDVARAILGQFGLDANAVAEMYGWELPEQDDDDQQYVDPGEQALERLQQMEAEKARQENEAAVDSYIQDEIKALEGKEGVEFSEEEKKALNVYARANPKEEVPGQLYPDVDAAHQLLSGIVKAGNKRLLDGKDKVPRRPGGGRAGSRAVDLSKESPEDFTARVASAVDAARASAQ